MGRCRCYCDAGFTDFDSPNPMMEGQPDAGPTRVDLLGNSLERAKRQRFIGLVLEILNASAGVVITDQAKKRGDRSIGTRSVAAVGYQGHQRLERQRSHPDGEQRHHYRSVYEVRMFQK